VENVKLIIKNGLAFLPFYFAICGITFYAEIILILSRQSRVFFFWFFGVA
jgi:hypothetical protein